ncbi:uncharacterized protein LOC135388560 [Ornithodoros turicata]|uniref:uncharacterized protein LOC135388560 n=1 Tax=Ornithodoros turicata TaxID=34597 RepID=UPI00313A0F2F
MPLGDSEKQMIASQLEIGVPVERIMTNLQSEFSGEIISPLDLTTRQDVRNIAAEYSLANKERLHQNDAISVHMWIKEQLEKPEPIVIHPDLDIFQQQNALPTTGEENFLLAIMTRQQREFLRKLGNKAICIDSTHGTTGYGFMLTSVLTIAEDGSGLPCAFLISKKTDRATLRAFFEAVKKHTGTIETEAFMTDDAPAFYNAWSDVMGRPEKRLLCIFHVRNNWNQNLMTKIKDTQLRKNVHDFLHTLMRVSEEDEFKSLLQDFLRHIDANSSLVEFSKYFKTHYAEMPNTWAMCYRLHTGLTTNNYLEGMHSQLKNHYFGDKHNQRLDKLLSFLLDMTKKILRDRMIGIHKGKNTKRHTVIFQSHQRSLSIQSEDIKEESDSWKVTSHDKTQVYTVCRREPCYGCMLVCKDCSTCAHDFSCTCPDYTLRAHMCKHIHAIAYREKAKTLQSNNAQASLSTPSTSTFSPAVDDPLELLRGACELNLMNHQSKATSEAAKDTKRLFYTVVKEFSKKSLECSEPTKVERFQAALRVLHESIMELTDTPMQDSYRTLPNKKLEKQPDFGSKGSTSSKGNKLRNYPTNAQEKLLKAILRGHPEEEHLLIHAGDDHHL